ncbi:MAG: FtsX-like permease family protein [Rhodospirillales bacterium]
MRELVLAWRLARRELRGGIAGFRIFLASLTLGVAAIAAVISVGDAVNRTLVNDARQLLGGDVEVRLVQRLPSTKEAAWLLDHAGATSQIVEMRVMARPTEDAAGDTPGDAASRATMAELKAVDGAYPLLGHVELSSPGGSSPGKPSPEKRSPGDLQQLLAPIDGIPGALAEAALADRLGVHPGERITVGDATFELRALILREPDRIASVAAFGPRLMVSLDALASTGLVQPGSLVRHATRVLLPPGEPSADWMAAARAAFPENGWQIRDPAEAAPGIDRFVQRLGMFLGFAGLTALLIGGLGVANAVRSYLDGKTGTIATLKCMGASARLVVATYLLQILVLAAFGTGIGLAVGSLLPLAVFGLIENLLPVRISFGIFPGALAVAALLGMLTALAFSLWPLGAARSVPAANLFRRGVVRIGGRPTGGWLAATAAVALALAALTIATATDPLFGALFVAGAIAVLAVLRFAAMGLAAAARRAPRAPHAVVRIAVDALHRPRAPTATVVTSLGAGLTVLVAVALIDGNLRTQIGERLPETVPAFFFIDIREDQAAAFDAAVAAVPGVGELKRVPSLRGRIVRLGDEPVETATIAPEAMWAVRADRALTFSALPPADAKITAGSWWPADYAGPPLISLDAKLAAGFGLGVGDRMTINILGRDIEATIASLRQIEWRAVPFDFAIIFSPGILEGAPLTHIAAVTAPAEAEPRLSAAIAREFSNVTAIRTRDAIEAVTQVMTKIGWGVRAAALVTIVAGGLVLAGAIAADRQTRAFEAVLFKVLGATRGRIAAIYAVEYGLLGFVTGIIAAGLGIAVAWAVTRYLMDFTWTLDGATVAITLALGVGLTLTIGFAATWRKLGRASRAFLRSD